jgi:hypothetical protein
VTNRPGIFKNEVNSLSQKSKGKNDTCNDDDDANDENAKELHQ